MTREWYQDAATGAPDLEVELVQDVSPVRHLNHPIQDSTSKTRTTTGEVQVFSCYCGQGSLLVPKIEFFIKGDI